MWLSSDTVNVAGISPPTRALLSQSIWYSLVVGSTIATSLRLVIIGSRDTDATTRSWAVNGVRPGPVMDRSSLASGCSLIRVFVSWMPVICASASTPRASSSAVRAAEWAPKAVMPNAISTSAAVISRPVQNIHSSIGSGPVAK